MIGSLAELFYKLYITSGIYSGIGQNFLEQVSRHQAGAGEAEQNAAWIQQLQRQHVDVLVTAAGAGQLILVLDEFRRIHDDQIEFFALSAVVAQQLEHVITNELRLVQIELVELDVLFGDVQRCLRGIHADHLCAAAHQSGNGEGAGVGEAVQHPAAGRVVPRLLARYHHLKPEALAKAGTRWPKLDLEFMTIHASKGQQAEYVIIAGLHEGRDGFPAVARESVLEEVLLPQPEDFPDAEERRLLYVALTRAKHQVWLLQDRERPSVFVEHLQDLGVPVQKKP